MDTGQAQIAGPGSATSDLTLQLVVPLRELHVDVPLLVLQVAMLVAQAVQLLLQAHMRDAALGAQPAFRLA